MTYEYCSAQPFEADAIAKVLYTPEREWSILQRGPVTLDVVIERRAKIFKKAIQTQGTQIIVAKVHETDEIASFAEWSIEKDIATVRTKEERKPEMSAFLGTFDTRMNLDLIAEISWKLGQMQIDVMQGRKHLFLNNLATLPTHRRKGLGSKLVELLCATADKERLPCFLTTEAAGEGRALYEKHGFRYANEVVLALGKYGGKGSVTYIGMIRQPG